MTSQNFLSYRVGAASRQAVILTDNLNQSNVKGAVSYGTFKIVDFEKV